MPRTEKTIFQKEDLKITDLEVTYKYDLIPVAEITGVEVKKQPAALVGGCSLMGIGAAAMLFVVTTDAMGSGCEFIPIVMIIGGGALLFARGSDSFQVYVQRGEKTDLLFGTKDEKIAQEIEAALQSVISKKKNSSKETK